MDLANPGIKPRSPTLQADSLPAEPAGKPKEYWSGWPVSNFTYTKCLVRTVSHGMFAVLLRARGRDLQLPPPQALLGPSRDGPLGTQWFGQH